MATHEDEYNQPIQEIPADWRKHLMVRLTAERAELIWKLIGFGEQTLVEQPVFEAYTAKDLLAHLAGWDELYAGRISLVTAGKEEEITGVELDEYNAALYKERKGWSLSQTVTACLQARILFEDAVTAVPDSLYHRPVQMPWDQSTSIQRWAQIHYEHDAAHAEDLAGWRERNKEARAIGPKTVVLAAMETARQEMLAVVALIPKDERETRPVCGLWSLKDVLGHVADWEWFGVEKWRPEQSNRSLQVSYPGTIQEWNDLHAAARQNYSWERVWFDFVNARNTLRQILEELDESELSRVDPAPWNPNDTIYRWILTWIHHEREHAADLRRELALPDFPERLTHV